VLYGWQGEGKEIVGFGQGMLPQDSGWSWANATPAPDKGKADMIYAPGAEREVASFYMIGGQMTGSASRVKLATLKARMLGGDQVAAAILISAENTQAKPARVQIDSFLKALGPVDQLAASLIKTARSPS
jgi:EpsI family protein